MKKLLMPLVLFSLMFQQTLFAEGESRDRAGAEWVEKTLKSLSLREKIGQMMMVSFSGEFANFGGERFAETRRRIEKLGLGGFTLFRGEANSIAALTNEAQRLAKIPLFFSADYERGLRMQLRTGTPFTTNMGVAAAGDPEAVYRQGKIICAEMRAIGANWLFAPVADVNNNPDNPVINIRSFGADPQKVGEFVAAEVRGVREAGCLATLKHFPGHGNTAVDSHIGLSTIPADANELNAVELAPFKTAILSGVDSVMTAHLAVPNVTGDSVPASLNPKITTDILRKELKFDGIITTDSLEMGAITKNYPNGESAVLAVKAGADLVLFPPDVDAAIDAVEAAVKRGEITESRLDESVRRLLSAKYRLGLTKNRFVDPARVNELVEKPENVAEANRVAERSITLLRNDGRVFPLSKDAAAKTLFVVVAADDDAQEGASLAPEIRKRVPNARFVRLDPRSTPDEYARVLDDAGKSETVLLAPFVKRTAGKGTVALPENQAAFVKRVLAAKNDRTMVVAFGNPYMIRQFPEAKNYVVTYAVEDVAQLALVKALFGETPFRGKLPIEIPDLFRVGAGIAD
ncbi:MAG: glycoside hydrolase family 3 C-terminal domain-containing protein [Acidobacteria bacterium]|nr:glycoside hydrolase family 3 C-terminal domain-containing protein [Acidobacteriota bacterium]